MVLQWQEIYATADRFVASILHKNNSLFASLASLSSRSLAIEKTLPVAPPVTLTTGTGGTEVDRLRVEKAERELRVEEKRKEVRETRALTDSEHALAPASQAQVKLKSTQELVAQREAEFHALEGGGGGKRVVGVKRVKGQPVVLVIIDASSAPFNEDRIKEGWHGGEDMGRALRSQIEEDIREHNIQLDEQDDQINAPVPAILGIVFHAKKALVGNLIKNKVIRSEPAWNDFIEGFTSLGNNQVIDIGSHPSPPLIAPLLLCLAPNSDVKLIYLAGSNVEQLKEACPELADARGAFYLRAGPKLVLINHRESEEELQSLRNSSGWRVVQWRRYFSSVNGLGADSGWGFRAPSPYVGPGDQNHEEGADDNGYADLSKKTQMQADKKSVAKGWGKKGWGRNAFE
ncbi:hypothetical protein JCM11251_003871 [Rhodosporidiobolus azoricus]